MADKEEYYTPYKFIFPGLPYNNKYGTLDYGEVIGEPWYIKTVDGKTGRHDLTRAELLYISGVLQMVKQLCELGVVHIGPILYGVKEMVDLQNENIDNFVKKVKDA